MFFNEAAELSSVQKQWLVVYQEVDGGGQTKQLQTTPNFINVSLKYFSETEAEQ